MMFVYTVKDDLLTIMLKGDIDHHSAASARQEVDSLIRQHRPKKTVLDFKGVTFCDSSAIAFAIGRQKLMVSCGGSAELVHVPKSAMRIFKLATLDRMMKISEK